MADEIFNDLFDVLTDYEDGEISDFAEPVRTVVEEPAAQEPVKAVRAPVKAVRPDESKLGGLDGYVNKNRAEDKVTRKAPAKTVNVDVNDGPTPQQWEALRRQEMAERAEKARKIPKKATEQKQEKRLVPSLKIKIPGAKQTTQPAKQEVQAVECEAHTFVFHQTIEVKMSGDQ